MSSNQPIRILLVSEFAAARQAQAIVFAQQPDLDVCGHAGTLSEARRLLRHALVDVAIVSERLPDGDGLSLNRDLRRHHRRACLILLVDRPRPTITAAALEAGACGVLDASSGIDDVIDAIRRGHAGEILHSPQEAVAIFRVANAQRARERASQDAIERLTPREREVLMLLADGLSDKDIAQRLSVSEKTVRNHMSSVIGVLGVQSRLQALLLAIRLGVINLDEAFSTIAVDE